MRTQRFFKVTYLIFLICQNEWFLIALMWKLFFNSSEPDAFATLSIHIMWTTQRRLVALVSQSQIRIGIYIKFIDFHYVIINVILYSIAICLFEHRILFVSYSFSVSGVIRLFEEIFFIILYPCQDISWSYTAHKNAIFQYIYESTQCGE